MSKAVARSLTPDNSKGGAPRRQKRPFWFKYRIPKSLLKKQQAQQEKQAKLAAAKKPAAKPEPKSKMKIKREKKKISRGRRRWQFRIMRIFRRKRRQAYERSLAKRGKHWRLLYRIYKNVLRRPRRRRRLSRRLRRKRLILLQQRAEQWRGKFLLRPLYLPFSVSPLGFRLNFPKTTFINRITFTSLLKHYLHLGQKRAQTHQEFRPFLLGFHNNISLINVTLLSYYLRRHMKFLLVLVMRNYRLCFISQEIAEYLASASVLRNYHCVLDYWIPGSVTNYLALSKQKVRRSEGFLRRYPQVLITFRLYPTKVYDICQEARKAGLPIISVLDTDLSPAYFNYVLPLNTKSLRSFHFTVFLFSALLRRSILLKKKKFLIQNAKCS